MATLAVEVDDALKLAADDLFMSFGMDTMVVLVSATGSHADLISRM